MAIAKRLKFDVDKFISIKARIADVYLNESDKIRRKASIHTNAIIFGEMLWLEEQIQLHGGGVLEDKDKKRYETIRRFLAGVRLDYGPAIKGGLNLKTSASVFGAMRFLCTQLEAIIKLADEELIPETLVLPPEQKAGRIEINLEEGIEDTEEETRAAIAAVGLDPDAEDEDADLPAMAEAGS